MWGHWLTEQNWQPFRVNDVLQFSDEDTASFLEDDLIGPSRVESGQLLGDAIVFTHPQGVHQSQLWLFSGSGISGKEAGVGGASGWNGQQRSTVNGWHFELTPGERAKRRGGGVVTSIDGGCIQPVGVLVQLNSKSVPVNLNEWNFHCVTWSAYPRLQLFLVPATDRTKFMHWLGFFCLDKKGSLRDTSMGRQAGWSWDAGSIPPVELQHMMSDPLANQIKKINNIYGLKTFEI
jgi:hypothetical protein